MNDIKTKYAGEIRMRRAYFRLTQSQLAEMTGISVDSISKIERADKTVKLESYLKCLHELNEYQDGCDKHPYEL